MEVQADDLRDPKSERMESCALKKGSAQEEEGEDCVICFDSITTAGRIPCCAHRFCFSCIHLWSKQTNCCPVCKRRFKSIAKIEQLPVEELKEADSTGKGKGKAKAKARGTKRKRAPPRVRVQEADIESDDDSDGNDFMAPEGLVDDYDSDDPDEEAFRHFGLPPSFVPRRAAAAARAGGFDPFGFSGSTAEHALEVDADDAQMQHALHGPNGEGTSAANPVSLVDCDSDAGDGEVELLLGAAAPVV